VGGGDASYSGSGGGCAGGGGASAPPAESSVVAEYREAYYKAYGPSWFFSRLHRIRARSYRRSYFKLLSLADGHLGKLLGAVDALEEQTDGSHPQQEQEEAEERTAVVFTSDHGDLLGAHGGLQQKW
jgi:arylsulfatase A-like enzyme